MARSADRRHSMRRTDRKGHAGYRAALPGRNGRRAASRSQLVSAGDSRVATNSPGYVAAPRPLGGARRVVVATALAAVAVLSAYWTIADRPKTVSFTAPAANVKLTLADTTDNRAAGLSNRDTIPNDGMLLQWSAPGRHPIWMSEMRFPLDLVWVDGEGRVVAALADVPPCTSAPCTLYEPAGSEKSTAVLELSAGKAATYGLTIGAAVRQQ